MRAGPDRHANFRQPSTASVPLLQKKARGRPDSAGMVAKLIACREAHRAGVGRIDIVTGTHTDDLDTSAGTTIYQVVEQGAPVSPSPSGRGPG